MASRVRRGGLVTAVAYSPPETSFRIVTTDRSWSSREVSRAGDAVAEALADVAGVGRGAVVGHQFWLDPGGAVALLAIAKAGGILAPLHPEWTAFERDAFVEGVEPSAMLAGPGTAWSAGGWTSRPVAVPGFAPMTLWLRRSSPGGGREARENAKVSARPVTGVEAGETAKVSARPAIRVQAGAILSTSGSSGLPRYAVHEWRSLRANAGAANERLDFGEESSWLATLAWAHAGGLAVAIRAAEAGAALAFDAPRFRAPTAVRALGELGASHISLVPAMLQRLLDCGARPPASLKTVLLGGAATPPRMVDRALESGWPVALTYGLTEAGSQVATATPAEVRRGDRSCGRALSGVDIRIRPPGQDGEIEIRGPTLFHGYLGERPHPRGEWFSTGDLGRLRADGRLEVVGRQSDRIVSGGASIDPAQIEAVLAAHPEVDDVAVVGMPDETFGQVVTAVIAGGDAATVSRVALWSREHLSGSRAPRRWESIEELPCTATGKVDRARVTEMVSESVPQEADS